MNKFDLKSPPWGISADDVLYRLETDYKHGLAQSEAEARLRELGPNALPENEEKSSLFGTIVDTFKEKLPAMLLISAIVSAILGLLMKNPDRFKDTFSLAIILLFMAIANYVMDKRKDESLATLKRIQKRSCRVMRDGKIIEVPITELTVGDVIVLKEGDLVPADARVVRAVNATVNEASLTGESMAVEKVIGYIAPETELSQRTNMIFMGTFMASGTITAIVTAIGLSTEFGKIADQIAKAEETLTPLQRQLDQLGDWLLNGTLLVCGLVGAVFLIRSGQSFLDLAKTIQEVGLLASWPHIATSLGVLADIFTVAVSLAIAFIPEALSAVIVLALAIGVNEMTAEGAIVKNPKGAEALGSVTIFDSDKTGTLTEGDMAVVSFWTKLYGAVEAKVVLKGNGLFKAIKEVMAYCNDKADATERALADFVADDGYQIGEQTEKDRVAMVPFTSARKLMSVLVSNGVLKLLTKGAPEVVLPLCTDLGGATVLEVEEMVETLTSRGYRVLALAERPADHENDLTEACLTLLGLVALIDPPRTEVVETITTIKAAGIIPVMITGDAGTTAQTIARQIGILEMDSTPDEIMSGRELEELIPDGDVTNVDTAVLTRISLVRVFYRVSPTHKKTIVMAQQKMGHIVAMTGDGVNDAPALKQADIGVAMGDRATEVTKEVADMILTSGYQAVAKAVRVGRTILLRTRLYTHALLSTNMAEVGLFILAALLGWATPLTSVMLLVINFLGDGWLSIALATEKPEKDVMTQKPRPSREAVITSYMWMSIAVQGVLVTALLGWVFYTVGQMATTMGLTTDATLKLQQSTVFAAFLVQKVARSSFTARSLKYNLWEIGVFSNRWTLLAGLTTLAMGVFFLEFGPVADFLGMVPLPPAVLPYLLLGLIPPAVEEAIKFVRRH